MTTHPPKLGTLDLYSNPGGATIAFKKMQWHGSGDDIHMAYDSMRFLLTGNLRSIAEDIEENGMEAIKRHFTITEHEPLDYIPTGDL